MTGKLLSHRALIAMWCLLLPAAGCATDSAGNSHRRGGGAAFVTGSQGVRIYTEDRGRKDAPAIVCVHGLRRDHRTWETLAGGELSSEYRLIFLDLRGHGRSDRPDDPSAYSGTRLWAEDLKAVLDHYRLEMPILLGWSFGGRVVLDYLDTYGDDSIAGLVLLSTAAATVPRPPRRRAGQRDSEAAPGWVTAAVHSSERRDHRFTLEKIGAPVMVVHGALDRVVPPSHADHTAALAADGTKIIFDGVGHAPHLEAPDEFNRLLLDFAGRVYGSAR